MTGLFFFTILNYETARLFVLSVLITSGSCKIKAACNFREMCTENLTDSKQIDRK